MPSIDIIRGFFDRPLLPRLAAALFAAGAALFPAAPLPAAEKIAVFPTAPYDAYLVYESLALFWIAILCLIVVIRMKLREIERTQALGADREEEDAPLLE